LINFEPQEEEMAMETYRTWVRLSELQRYYSWIVDRFHISTQMHQLRAYGKRYDFSWLENKLRPLGFRLVFCTRRPESFEAARKERLKVSGKPSQYDNLHLFEEEQTLFESLIKASTLPAFTVDVSDNSVSNAVETIAHWMERTGGLTLD
jgi:thymidylate kinase